MGVWDAFEGELGGVRLFDGNRKELVKGILLRSGPIVFTTTLEFGPRDSAHGLLVLQTNHWVIILTLWRCSP